MKLPAPPKRLPPKLTPKLTRNNRCDEYSEEGAGLFGAVLIIALLAYLIALALIVWSAQ